VLSKRTGQAFFVENKPGAGTVVGTLAAAQSEPDGYTLLVGGLSNMAFNSALYSNSLTTRSRISCRSHWSTDLAM